MESEHSKILNLVPNDEQILPFKVGDIVKAKNGFTEHVSISGGQLKSTSSTPSKTINQNYLVCRFFCWQTNIQANYRQYTKSVSNYYFIELFNIHTFQTTYCNFGQRFSWTETTSNNSEWHFLPEMSKQFLAYLNFVFDILVKK